MKSDYFGRSAALRGASSTLVTVVLILTALLLSTAACSPSFIKPAPTATPTAEQATLASLQLVDDYPLYTMRYVGSYRGNASLPRRAGPALALGIPGNEACTPAWGCSLFATLGDENNRLLGRNFDWDFSPAVLLFTDPPDGYASVSMVDIFYLGFGGDRSKSLMTLPLEERRALLDAPSLPFDGMNERGLAVGMAAVVPGNMPIDPKKDTIGELQAIREILDHAATVDEAAEILGGHNIDMGDVPIHYLIATASGESAVVEFYNGEMVVQRNQATWQAATNFILAGMGGHPEGECWRYDKITERLQGLSGRIAAPDAVDLLKTVSQDSTQWSVVYHMTTGDIDVVMGRGYSEPPHTLHLTLSSE